MKPYSRIAFAVLVLVSFVMTGCATPTPEVLYAQPTRAPRTVQVEKAVEVVEVTKEAEMPRPLPTATVSGDAGPGPSTGGDSEPNDQPFGDVFFEDYGVNPRIDTDDDHLSTFAVDVDTASYTVMRRYINDGFLPPDEAVRVEEFINFFEQEYAPPEKGAFAIHIEGAPSPYDEAYHLQQRAQRRRPKS